LGGMRCRGGLDALFVPEHTLACLYTICVLGATGVAELVSAPAEVRKQNLA
jgi:hypothetical protein